MGPRKKLFPAWLRYLKLKMLLTACSSRERSLKPRPARYWDTTLGAWRNGSSGETARCERVTPTVAPQGKLRRTPAARRRTARAERGTAAGRHCTATARAGDVASRPSRAGVRLGGRRRGSWFSFRCLKKFLRLQSLRCHEAGFKWINLYFHRRQQ